MAASGSGGSSTATGLVSLSGTTGTISGSLAMKKRKMIFSDEDDEDEIAADSGGGPRGGGVVGPDANCSGTSGQGGTHIYANETVVDYGIKSEPTSTSAITTSAVTTNITNIVKRKWKTLVNYI